MINDDELRQLQERNPGRVAMPRQVASVLNALKQVRAFKSPTKLIRAQRAWEAIAGEEIASVSKVTAFVKGDLKVTVSSQALVHELGRLRHDALVEAINVELDGKDRVARIVVRSGRIQK